MCVFWVGSGGGRGHEEMERNRLFQGEKNNSMEIGNSGGTLSHLFVLIKGLVVRNDGNEAGKMVQRNILGGLELSADQSELLH